MRQEARSFSETRIAAPRERLRLHLDPNLRWKATWTALIIGAMSASYVRVGAQLYVAEVLLTLLAVIALASPERLPLPRWIPWTLGAWATVSLVSDLAAGSGMIDSLKGILRVFMVTTCTIALVHMFAKDRATVRWLWGGTAIAGVIAYVLQPDVYAAVQPWKFGLGMPVTMAVIVAVSARRRFDALGAAMIMALAVAHFALGFRTMAIVCAITVMLLIVARTHQDGLPRRAWFRLATVGAIAVMATVAVVGLWDQLARSGSLGTDATAKASTLDGQYGTILGSRSEVLIAALSITHDPVLGVGTGGTPAAVVDNFAAQLYETLGYSYVSDRITEGRALFHSMALGTVAENGLITLAFWAGFVVLVIRALAMVLAGSARFPVLATFLSVLALWDTFFSPFGAERRFWVAATIATLLVATRQIGDDHDHDVGRDSVDEPARVPPALRRERAEPASRWRRAHRDGPGFERWLP
ncbi:hypothetical protein [Demequina rhizosphaerae]|uniref:hypothetical protein n=1 Tax=Demequina rhizosphaerae TaxID=1638985 RepID=UPI000785C589|nr:hypothetical protein [Demequina rhizosphaerae]